MYSKQIEGFLNFLREAQQGYDIAVSSELEANNETQDILHATELKKNTYHEHAQLSKLLCKVRQKRRAAKDTKQQLEPVSDWVSENQKVIHSLEMLLGIVRKAEKNAENRYYNPKTEILKETYGGYEDEEN